MVFVCVCIISKKGQEKQCLCTIPYSYFSGFLISSPAGDNAVVVSPHVEAQPLAEIGLLPASMLQQLAKDVLAGLSRPEAGTETIPNQGSQAPFGGIAQYFDYLLISTFVL